MFCVLSGLLKNRYQHVYYTRICLPPINIVQILKIFSDVVFADTLPNPTLVKLEQVKYNAVTYDSLCVMLLTSIFNLSAKVCNHPEKKKNIFNEFTHFLSHITESVKLPIVNTVT